MRSVRVFLSSTFRDFHEERDLLVRQVFPSLRAKLKARMVELVDVDLRWGITVQQAERGAVLPICLAEIDRSRPYFIGILGERYGWIPPIDCYSPDLIERQPWLKKHQGGKSVTELEILYGVLNNPKMAGRAFFYFRSPSWASAKGGDYVPASAEDARRQRILKAHIRRSQFPVLRYRDPRALAKRLENDLWKLLDAEFPVDSIPDAFEREALRHEAYAIPRRQLYLGGEQYLKAIDRAIGMGQTGILIEGASGAGKSALIANWIEAHRRKNPKSVIHEHYLGASADAATPHSLVRRLIEAIQRITDSPECIVSDPQQLLDSIPRWLAIASGWAAKRKTRWVIVFDSLNSLTSLNDLRWFPAYFPERVHIVVTCLSGSVLDALRASTKREFWTNIVVKPLTVVDRKELLVRYLARFNKTLPEDLIEQIVTHQQASNPLFIRTLAEELRLFGIHEQLKERLSHYLAGLTVDDLFQRVLERVESDCGRQAVRDTMAAIWASRAGLTEGEILAFAGLVPATWAPIRNALDEALLDSNGRLNFVHDYLRIAVRDRYLETNRQQMAMRRRLGSWFRERPVDARRVEEEPFQWLNAGCWSKLQTCLTDRPMFEALREYVSDEELLGYWVALEANTRKKAERVYERVWAGWKTKKIDESTADLAGSVASFLLKAGRYGHFTEWLFRRALAIRERAMGKDHPETAKAFNDLSVFLTDRGKYAEAEVLSRRALAIGMQKLGEEHLYTGHYHNTLACVLQRKGNYEAAEVSFRKALLITEKVLGGQHPQTAISLNNLAGMLHDKGDYKTAELLHRRALAIREKIFGGEHPDTAMSLNNVAQVLCDTGNGEAAESLLRRALESTEKMLGPYHPQTAVAMNNLGGFFHDRGDLITSELMYRRALAIDERAFGEEHPDTAVSMNNLALVLCARGRYEAAESLYRRALKIKLSRLGEDHPGVAIGLNNLAEFLRQRGDSLAAEPLYKRALEISEKCLGERHPDTKTFLNNLVVLLGDQDRLIEAKELLFRRITMVRQVVTTGDDALLVSLRTLGVRLRDAGELKEADQCLCEALRIVESVDVKDHLAKSFILSALGQLRFLQRRYKDATALFGRCLRIRKSELPANDDAIVVVEARLAEVKRVMRIGKGRKND